MRKLGTVPFRMPSPIKIISISILLVLCTSASMGCTCKGGDFIAESVLAKRSVFDGTVVCAYRDPDITKLFEVKFYLFKVHRYWSGNFSSDYVLVAADVLSSCMVSFKEGERYILSGSLGTFSPVSYGPSYIFVNQCGVREANQISAEDWTKAGNGIAMSGESERPTEPCGAFAELEKQAAIADSIYMELQKSNEKLSGQAQSYKLMIFGLLAIVVAAILYRTSKKLRQPFRILVRSYLITIGVTFACVILMLTNSVFYYSDHGSQTVPDLFWLIVLVPIAFVVASLPSLAMNTAVVRSNRAYIVLTFLLLPTVLFFYMLYDFTQSVGDFTRIADLAVVIFGLVYVVALFVQVMKLNSESLQPQRSSL